MKFLKHITYGGHEPSNEIKKRYKDRQMTVFVDIPDPDDFVLNVIASFDRNEFEINLGVSTLHPQDKFDKAMGSQLAIIRKRPVLFRLHSLFFCSPDQVRIVLYTDLSPFYVKNRSLEIHIIYDRLKKKINRLDVYT